MGLAGLNVRRAQPDDAEAIQDLGQRTFRAAYNMSTDPDDLEAYIAKTYSISAIEAELRDGKVTYLLAHNGDDTIGYLMIRNEKAPGCVNGEKPAQLSRIYVEPEAIGTGCGAALMLAGLQEVASAGFDVFWLSVWECNARAISFYEKWDFVQVGMAEFVVGHDKQNDFIMARTI